MRFDLFVLVLISLQVLSQENETCENNTLLPENPIPLKQTCNQKVVEQGRVCCFVTYKVGTVQKYECANLLNETKYFESYDDLKDTEFNEDVKVICNSNTLISSFVLILALLLF